MKLKLIVSVLLIIAMLTGCSPLIGDNTDLIRPPRATGDKAGIQELIELQAGGKYTFKYPQSGDYRSAITMKDLDGDGSDEAIALFRPATDQSNTAAQGGINIMIMKEISESWTSIGSFISNNAEVNRIQFADINGDGVLEIIVGLSNYASTANQLIVYYFKGKEIEQLIMNQTYNEIIVDDFTGNGLDDVLLLSLPGSEGTAAVQLIKSAANRTDYEVVNTTMDPEITKYSKITYGVITSGTEANEQCYGLVIDGVKVNGSLSTEVIYWDKKDGRIRDSYNMVEDPTITDRTTQTVSKDINSDGVLEIPTVRAMYKEEHEPSDIICNETEWTVYDVNEQKFIKVLDTVVNYSDGYFFVIPASWQNKITARYDVTTKMMDFYEWKENKKGELLLRLQVFTDKEWESVSDGYTKISAGKNAVFAKRNITVTSELVLSDNEIIQNFQLINNN